MRLQSSGRRCVSKRGVSFKTGGTGKNRYSIFRSQSCLRDIENRMASDQSYVSYIHGNHGRVGECMTPSVVSVTADEQPRGQRESEFLIVTRSDATAYFASATRRFPSKSRTSRRGAESRRRSEDRSREADSGPSRSLDICSKASCTQSTRVSCRRCIFKTQHCSKCDEMADKNAVNRWVIPEWV